MKKEANRKKAVIHGYYGAGNFGDDIILLSIIRALREMYPELQITVLTRDISPIPKEQPFNTVSRFDLKKTEMAIREADMLICGGGGILQDYSGFDFSDHFDKRNKGLDYYAVPVEMAYLCGKPVMFYAVGAGPCKGEPYRKYLKTVLSWADTVSVRDQPSAALLMSVSPGKKPIVTADPAVNFIQTNPPVEVHRDTKGKKVGICLRSWLFKGGGQAEYSRIFADMAEHLISKYGFQIILFPFNKGKNDINFIKQIFSEIKWEKHVEVKEGLNLRQTLAIMLQLDYLIGMRLHSVIVGASNMIPSLGIAYDGKVSQFISSLHIDDCVLDLEDLKKKQLIEKLDAFVGNRKKIKTQLMASIPALQEQELKNACLAADILRR